MDDDCSGKGFCCLEMVTVVVVVMPVMGKMTMVILVFVLGGG